MKRLFIGVLLVGAVLMTVGCSRPQSARRVLDLNGFTQVQTHGYIMYGCGQGDTFATKFTALSPTGVPVTGVVCEGLLKGATIRIF